MSTVVGQQAVTLQSMCLAIADALDVDGGSLLTCSSHMSGEA